MIGNWLIDGHCSTEEFAPPRRFRRWWSATVLLLLGGLVMSPAAKAAGGDLVWARQLGGTDFDEGQSVAVDAGGNVYTTGYFNGTVDFDPGIGSNNLTSAGAGDVFVSKLDSAGGFVWARQLGGTGSDRGFSVVVDALGNVYTTGQFAGTADFDPGIGSNNLTSAGDGDVFVSKLDSAGGFVWARQLGGTDSDMGRSVAVDASGNVYTTGSFRGTADFDPGAGSSNLTSSGPTDVFVWKLDAAGGFLWARQLGGTSYDSGVSAAVDALGNVYTTGNFYGTADFDPGLGSNNLTSAGSDDVFVSKLDASGGFVWVRQLGGTDSDGGESVAVDALGNVYTTGYFSATADFDPGVGSSNLVSAGAFDVFVSKLDASGGFVWARRMGDTDYDVGLSVAVDALGSVYTTGNFFNTADFDPGIGTSNLTSSGATDVFVWKLDASGGFVWARQLGGTGSDSGPSVAVDASGNVHTTGYFSGTADFDPGAGTSNLTSAGSFDAFVAKLAVADEYVEYVPLVPGRLMDTRTGGTTVDGLFQAIGARAAGSTTELQVTGRHGVPADAEAVVLNVTVTVAQGNGFVTVYPCGAALPNASNLNYFTGDTVPNLVITQIGTGGKVCLYTYAATHLIADLDGYYPAGSNYAPLVPGRLLDTRTGGTTVDGQFQAIGSRAAGSTTELQVAGRGGVSADAEAVVLNVTVTVAQGNGFVTVYPCGAALPNASNLNFVNFVTGDTIPNLVIAPIGTGGKVCIYTSAATHLIADLDGYYPAGSNYAPLVPGRLMDTRTGGTTVDGQFQGIGIRTAGSTTELQVAGRGGAPVDADSVVLNITVTAAQGNGFITVYPCGTALPNASNLNFVNGDTVANLVISKVGTDAKICLYTSANTHLIADINGYNLGIDDE